MLFTQKFTHPASRGARRMAENSTTGPSSGQQSGSQLATTSGNETPPPVIQLSDTDISRLASEVVAIMDRRRDSPPATSSAGPSAVAPPGDHERRLVCPRNLELCVLVNYCGWQAEGLAHTPEP